MDGEDCGMVQGSDVVLYAEDGGDCDGLEVWQEIVVLVNVKKQWCVSCVILVRVMALVAVEECLGCHLE